jgi:PAS domain S-box-containing protein
VPIYDDAGNLTALEGIARDITERKRAEAELRETRDYLDNLIGYANAPIIVWNPAFRITRFNHAFERLTGYIADEMIGQELRVLFPETSRDESLDKIARTSSGEYWESVEIPILRKDGAIRIALWNSANIHAADGKTLLATIAQGQDITERKRAEETQKKLTKELTRSNKELEQFAYVASHDLQEPLRKVQAFGDRLKAKYTDSLDDEGRDYLERMFSAAARMSTMISDLLAYSRVTTTAQPFVPVNLAQVAQEVVSDLEARIEQTRGHVDVGDLPTIDADHLQMRQLLQNLVSNALKFHREAVPPVVRVYSKLLKEQGAGISSTGEICQIMVEDNGIGLDEKYLSRIFQPFQRLHSRSEYEGTGIGLAICRKIAERHGGSITAKSNPGQGATFIVTLPVRQASGEEAQ